MTITEAEKDELKKQGALEADVRYLKETTPQIFAELKAMNSRFAQLPMDMAVCKDAIDKEVKAYAHDVFITDDDLKAFEVDITQQIGGVKTEVSRAKWVVSGFIAAAAVFIWWVTATTKIHNLL